MFLTQQLVAKTDTDFNDLPSQIAIDHINLVDFLAPNSCFVFNVHDHLSQLELTFFGSYPNKEVHDTIIPAYLPH